MSDNGGVARARARGDRDVPVRLRGRWIVGGNLIVAAVYFVLAQLALLLVRETGLASPVWPAAGVAVGAVFLRGPWLLPGVFIGSFAANYAALLRDNGAGGTEILVSAGIGIAASSAALLGGTLARRAVGARPPLTQGREVLTFLFIAGPVAAAVSALIGTVTQVLGGVVSSTQTLLVWLTWWVGDSIGIIVVLPIVLMFAPEQARDWLGRRWKVAIPSLLMLAGVVLAVLQNAALVVDQREMILRQEGQDAASALQSELNLHQELLDSIVSLRKASDDVTAREFQEFTASFLARHPDLQAVSWNPLVSNAERSAFEAAQRAQPGMADFEITERNPDGELVPAGTRPEYVTVAYIEPIEANRKALGYDVSSNEVRAEAIARARSTGTQQITAPIELVQETGTQWGALMFAPASGSPGELDGFAVGVYRIGDLLSSTMDRHHWRDLDFALYDRTPGSEPQLIATRSTDGMTAPPAGVDIAEQEIQVGGRTWILQTWPTKATLAAQQPATASLVLIGGFLVMFLLEAFLLLLTGMEHRARKEADSSSYDAVHDELTGLLNRRGFFQNLEAVRSRVMRDGSSSVLMYLDLDGFKAVNDKSGHDAGDALLRAISRTIQRSVRERDTVARLGGDEFAIVANNVDLERGEVIAESIQSAVAGQVFEWGAARHSVGVSIGLAAIEGPDAPDVDALVRAADAACYQAKHAGRGTIRTATSE